VSKSGVYEYKGSKSVCLGARKRSGTDSRREESALHGHFRDKDATKVWRIRRVNDLEGRTRDIEDERVPYGKNERGPMNVQLLGYMVGNFGR